MDGNNIAYCDTEPPKITTREIISLWQPYIYFFFVCFLLFQPIRLSGRSCHFSVQYDLGKTWTQLFVDEISLWGVQPASFWLLAQILPKLLQFGACGSAVPVWRTQWLPWQLASWNNYIVKFNKVTVQFTSTVVSEMHYITEEERKSAINLVLFSEWVATYFIKSQ